ncbi:VOC family protein [Neorhizobium alkalisoli]|uniref:Glyoxalase/bleomycin resistance protein/dioxygenase superfamily protein n=1 Tax=Neorhizobium alkalisoli TaxID=528178 RepID=A0A561QRY9_9HYPH|nr:VOC family protein [Neorhizobium alkalisoli]TWF53150.1 glyoxalase/bleomycin resistance protein/dioxygenase superfamily protein [Neorhizobium alkalisoli]
MQAPVLRIARPTDDIGRLRSFYETGLGFEQLAAFEDHQGFDGLILGHARWPYHLEFTHQRGHTVGRAPSADNLIVLYLPDRSEWTAATTRMQTAVFKPVPSYNPYWDQDGQTFEDPDGYRVVLQNSAWSR